MTSDQFYRAVHRVLKDEAGEWRELQSCADAIQDISYLLGQGVRTRPHIKRARKTAGQRTHAPAAVELALTHLKHARQELRRAGALRAADRVGAALSSAYGARRHAENRVPR